MSNELDRITDWMNERMRSTGSVIRLALIQWISTEIREFYHLLDHSRMLSDRTIARDQLSYQM
jgi:hypothetical protein